MSDFDNARALIWGFKGDQYDFGDGALARSGALAAQLGTHVVVIHSTFSGAEQLVDQVVASLQVNGVSVLTDLQGAAPNAPRDDVKRLAREVAQWGPDAIVVIGGGSPIDAAKAASVLATQGGSIDNYFGTGLVTETLASSGRPLIPVLAVQTASSSGAHLTKYSNITDVESGQKKLIVDEAIVPPRAVFQYDVTTSMPAGFTADGALDGISHMIEVLYSAVGTPDYQKTEDIAAVGVQLIVNYLERAVEQPTDLEAREALGLGTDLGGYSIMVGGTNGGHLTSFSLVDVLSHGRACAITNPYWTVFFAPAIERPLRMLGGIYKNAGLTSANIDTLSGRALGEAVAEAMMELEHRIGFPTTLGAVDGFTEAHVERALTAAKNPQLMMKLQNMPVPMTTEMVDDYMGPILEASTTGDLGVIKNVA
jgi:alcohol dehydrogenase class IV